MALPRDDTAFFGRGPELLDVAQRLAGGARLVTIVGLGGVGKTRLAIAAAAQTKRATVFVGLGEARSVEAAVREVASATRSRVKAESQARAALATLAAALAKRGPALLLLDNTEQLGAAAGELITGLLDGAPELVVLVTAREPAGVRGEEKLVLAPLADDEAVALLRDRVRVATGAAAELAEADALAIVRRVDGIPLAIELAASRLEVLSPSELLRRLAERLDVLADASGSAPRAHRTMRATLDWSWDLLSDRERRALAQVSVFAAPFGIDAAEEVVVLEGAALHEGEAVREADDVLEGGAVLDVLESLVQRSLVFRVTTDGSVRLGMFGTVRAWARGKLDAFQDPAVTHVRMRHALHHLAEAERAAARAYGERAVAALDSLEVQLPELLVAFEATRECAPETAARIVLALSDLLLFRGLFELRAELFAAGAEAAKRAGDPRLIARTLVAKARVTLEEGRMQDAEAELRQALAIATSAHDEVTSAEATRSLGWALTALGRTDEAELALESARAAHREQGSARGLADVHVALGIAFALRGRAADALAELQQALAIHVENGDVLRQEKVLGFGLLVGHDALEIARGLPREVLARAPASSIDVLPAYVAEVVRGERDAGQRWQRAIDLYRQGVAAEDRNELADAIVLFDRAIEELERVGVRHGLAAIHAHAAATIAASGDSIEASARLARAFGKAGDDPAASRVVAVFASAVDVLAGRDRASAAELFQDASRAEVSSPALSIATRVLGRALAVPAAPGDVLPSTTDPVSALLVGRDARSFVLPRGERIDLGRYGPVRRLLDRLVVARLEQPGVALSAEQLIEAGWPGERMRHTAGLLRVYSAVRRLRRLGLEPLLVTRDDGYLLDPEASVRRED